MCAEPGQGGTDGAAHDGHISGESSWPDTSPGYGVSGASGSSTLPGSGRWSGRASGVHAITVWRLLRRDASAARGNNAVADVLSNIAGPPLGPSEEAAGSTRTTATLHCRRASDLVTAVGVHPQVRIRGFVQSTQEYGQREAQVRCPAPLGAGPWLRIQCNQACPAE